MDPQTPEPEDTNASDQSLQSQPEVQNTTEPSSDSSSQAASVSEPATESDTPSDAAPTSEVTPSAPGTSSADPVATQDTTLPTPSPEMTAPSSPWDRPTPPVTPVTDTTSSAVTPDPLSQTAPETSAQPEQTPGAVIGMPPSAAVGQPMVSTPPPGDTIVSPPIAPELAEKPPKKSRLKLFAIIVAAVIVLGGGGAAAFYYGYYTNASFLYSQSLADSNTAYTKLINYFNQESAANYKGIVGSGTYKVTTNGSTDSGSLNFESDGGNSDTNVNVGLGVANVNVEVKTIKPAGQADPDIYLKASGINSLGALLGSSQAEQAIDQLNGQWIEVDHTLLQSLQSELGETSSASSSLSSLTQADVYSELTAFGQVNKQYLLSTNKSTAVTKVLKTYGEETVDGHKTIHYLVGFNKANVKAYITAQENALMSSKLGAWIKQQGYTSEVTTAYNSMETSANSINSSDTFQYWANMSTRLPYKVRISDASNPALNYMDIGLNYTGGDTFPIFVNTAIDQSGSKTDFYILTTLNTDTNSVALSFNMTDSGGPDLTGNLTFKQTNDVTAITAPTGAVPIETVLQELGLSSALSPSSLTSGASTTSDASSNSSISI